MKQSISTVKVYIPDEGKCLKITNGNKIITYMKEPYYELPHYKYKVEEANIEEADKWFKRSFSKVKNIFKFLR